jgi:glycosyltransferase involved in cell wall biosynthesis
MIKILFIHGITAIGGAERDLITILSSLDRNRFEPVIVIPDEGPLAKILGRLGAKIYYLPLPPWRKLKFLPVTLLSIFRIYRIAVREKINLVHVNDMWWVPIGFIVSRLAGAPVVAFLRQELEPRRIGQYWLNRADSLVAVSRSIQETLIDGHVDPNRVHTIYSGVDTGDTGLTAEGAEQPVLNPDPVIGTIANIFPHKGLEYLIAAVHILRRRYPGISCRIVGSGDRDYQEKLKEQVQRLDLSKNIHFLGFQEDIRHCLNGLQVFVLPSILEAFGIVLLEAMAMRKAVVASRVGGIPEIVVNGENGFLVPPGDPEALANSIQRLIEDPILRERFERTGLERVKTRFTRRRMIQEISAQYEALAYPERPAREETTLPVPTVSALIITLNEEKNIRECLERLDWVDEIVVVDAESRDRTQSICSEFPVRWFQRPWPGFGPQKNFGIEQATGNWILIVDADERITPELKKEILAVIRNGTPYSGFEIPRRNIFYGRWIRYGGAFPDYQLRLFRKNDGHYDQTPVHEKFILKGTAGYLKAPFEHYTERVINDHFKKFDQYTSLAAFHEAERNRSPHWSQCTVNPILTFLKIYLLKRGFLDGVHGIIYSTFVAMYTFVKYAKLWELKQK